MKTYPTPWQKKTIWSALTALAMVTLGAVAVFVIWLLSRILSFLQPILIPFAVAGVMAYLLDPVVNWMVRNKIPRRRAVLMVFITFTIAVIGMLVWIVPAVSHQTITLAAKVPGYVEGARQRAVEVGTTIRKKYGIRLPLVPGLTAPATTPSPTPAPSQTPSPLPTPAHPEPSTSPLPASASPTPATEVEPISFHELLSGDWVATTLPNLVKSTWKVIISSVGGFLGVFGFLLSLIIVPLYLYYLLTESANISQGWSNYLPLRNSRFKDEVVSALTEINGYLIAFFRGQLLVSMINGLHTGLWLGILGIDFWMLIGLMVAVLNLIPYVGIILCWLPAVIIAAMQSGTWLIPASDWWVLPLVVTGVFILVQQIDGLFITPKIVGESVGLHPMTVILAVLIWSLLLGGLLGAILAVPLTATLKVLLRRYVWEKRRVPAMTPELEG